LFGLCFYKYAAPDGAENRRSVAVPPATAMFKLRCAFANPLPACFSAERGSVTRSNVQFFKTLSRNLNASLSAKLLRVTDPRSGGRPQELPAAGGAVGGGAGAGLLKGLTRISRIDMD